MKQKRAFFFKKSASIQTPASWNHSISNDLQRLKSYCGLTTTENRFTSFEYDHLSLVMFVLWDAKLGSTDWPSNTCVRSDWVLQCNSGCTWTIGPFHWLLSIRKDANNSRSWTISHGSPTAQISYPASVDHLPLRVALLQHHRDELHTILKLLIYGMYYLFTVGISRENPRGFSKSE